MRAGWMPPLRAAVEHHPNSYPVVRALLELLDLAIEAADAAADLAEEERTWNCHPHEAAEDQRYVDARTLLDGAMAEANDAGESSRDSPSTNQAEDDGEFCLARPLVRRRITVRASRPTTAAQGVSCPTLIDLDSAAAPSGPLAGVFPPWAAPFVGGARWRRCRRRVFLGGLHDLAQHGCGTLEQRVASSTQRDQP